MAETLPNGVTTRTIYLARDGREFYSVGGAVHHNEDLDRAQAANLVLMAGGSVYDAAKAAGRSREAEILKRVTSETPLVISHWQCRDTPGYKVHRFENPWQVYVGGDAGSWSGSYGDIVDLRDLARYAEETARRYPEVMAPCPPLEEDAPLSPRIAADRFPVCGTGRAGQ